MAASNTAAVQRYGRHAWIPEVQADWTHGMVYDTALDAIPAGSVYTATDYLLHQPGVAQKRGGTSFYGPAMTGATICQLLVYAFYAAGPQLLAVGDNGHLYKVTTGATTDVATLGATFNAKQKPVVIPSSAAILSVFFSNDGTTAPKKWDGTAAANLGGSPPAALMGTVYKQRLVIANSAANPNRIWFSEVPSVESTWDTSNKYVDTEQEISGLAALNNQLLVFHLGSTERIIGSIPPGAAGADMDKANTGWSVGCTDGRSIAMWDGNCIFASPRGVYMTNGTTPVSLTGQGGIDNHWRSLFPGYDPHTWAVSCGVTRQFLFVTVQTDLGVNKGQLMCHLPTRAWWKVSNMQAMMYANIGETVDNLLYADRNSNRVVSLAGIFDPQSSNANDANGNAVLPTITFAPFGVGPGVKSYGFGRLDYDMNNVSGNSPTMTVEWVSGLVPNFGLANEPAESPLAASSTFFPNRKRFSLCTDAQMLMVSLTQALATSKTELYAIEVEQRPRSTVGDGTG